MKAKTEINYQQRILRVLNYINKHIDDDLSLEQCAAIAHFSAYHFHRIFTQTVGESLKEYIRRRKTQRAVFQLNMTDRTITEIAFDAGFNSTEAFSRHIKKHFGASPRDIRQGKIKIFNQLHQEFSEQPPLPIEIIERPATDLAYLLHIGPYEEAVKVWETMTKLVGVTTLLSKKTECYGIPYDHPLVVPVDKCHYAACISWRDTYSDIPELHRMTLAPGRHAMVTHNGPIETIEETYKQFAHTVMNHDAHTDLEFAEAASFMRYDLPNWSKPKSLKTHIYFPLA